MQVKPERISVHFQSTHRATWDPGSVTARYVLLCLYIYVYVERVTLLDNKITDTDSIEGTRVKVNVDSFNEGLDWHEPLLTYQASTDRTHSHPGIQCIASLSYAEYIDGLQNWNKYDYSTSNSTLYYHFSTFHNDWIPRPRYGCERIFYIPFPISYN